MWGAVSDFLKTLLSLTEHELFTHKQRGAQKRKQRLLSSVNTGLCFLRKMERRQTDCPVWWSVWHPVGACGYPERNSEETDPLSQSWGLYFQPVLGLALSVSKEQRAREEMVKRICLWWSQQTGPGSSPHWAYSECSGCVAFGRGKRHNSLGGIKNKNGLEKRLIRMSKLFHIVILFSPTKLKVKNYATELQKEKPQLKKKKKHSCFK